MLAKAGGKEGFSELENARKGSFSPRSSVLSTFPVVIDFFGLSPRNISSYLPSASASRNPYPSDILYTSIVSSCVVDSRMRGITQRNNNRCKMPKKEQNRHRAEKRRTFIEASNASVFAFSVVRESSVGVKPVFYFAPTW
ncbi:hypothetical protein GW17_00019579 [Ensete ventricosum]|nr:hypothetical protein GW17_00019579 [Ensete ventricosum]